MEPLTFLGLLTGGALAVNFLGELTAPAPRYLERVNGAASRPTPQDSLVEQQPPQDDLAPQEQRAGWWWKELLSLKAMLGLLFSPVELPILAVNSFLIAMTFEVILDRAGQPLFVIDLWGWEREVTAFDLYGVLVSVGQMICGSAYHHARADNGRSTLIRRAAALALLSLVTFEVGATIYRGSKLDGALNAALSGMIALGTAGTEVVVGIYMIDWFLAPLLLAVLWSATSPAWALAGWWERRRARRRWAGERRKAKPVLLALAWPLAAVDRTVMDPLRRLDHAVARLFSGDKHEFSKEGGQPNVEKPFDERHESTPGNGSDPAGVRQHQAIPASNGMDSGVGHHSFDSQRAFSDHAR